MSGDRSQRVSFSPEEGQACSSYDGDRCEFRDNDITYIGLLESCDAEIVPVDDEIRR
ncbi:hypothetical protein HY450_02890 [Candidatus Pacearchaeota archaeon]|nr:hypothetical protein [Candidatus Pacearchaeota archaeon]